MLFSKKQDAKFYDLVREFTKSNNVSPVTPRQPFYIGSARVGSIDEKVAWKLVQTKLVFPLKQGVGIDEDLANVNLMKIAYWLRNQGLAAKWRDEQLTVTDENGCPLATVERAVVRTLGIKTFAVHLVGVCEDGRIWLQRRADNKATDPGMLDTLVGGLVAANESFEQALQRETWEEAGLEWAWLEPVKKGGELIACCPIDPQVGGYMAERSIWYVAQIPDTVSPRNQDGEVSDFVKLSADEIVTSALAGDMAKDAVLILNNFLFQQQK